MKSNKILISFIGETGKGKSTASKILMKKLSNSCILKLAKPLYEIQDSIYEKLGLEINSQDGELLQFLGNKIQTIKPDYLAQEFEKEVLKNNNVINDDCRPHNYKYLKEMGFKFVYIEGPLRERKEDVSSVDKNNPVEWTDEKLKGKFDFIIQNKRSLEDLSLELDKLIHLLK